ncbi:MAG: tautomerase family protein [Alphaproteobacteria bacterium]|nr:tautomerase family protein [Alphaproteobacteria bacterium]
MASNSPLPFTKENAMPWITINMFEGRTEKTKLKLLRTISKAVAEIIDTPLEGVHVQIVEMKKKNYAKGGVRGDKI